MDGIMLTTSINSNIVISQNQSDHYQEQSKSEPKLLLPIGLKKPKDDSSFFLSNDIKKKHLNSKSDEIKTIGQGKDETQNLIPIPIFSKKFTTVVVNGKDEINMTNTIIELPQKQHSLSVFCNQNKIELSNLDDDHHLSQQQQQYLQQHNDDDDDDDDDQIKQQNGKSLQVNDTNGNDDGPIRFTEEDGRIGGSETGMNDTNNSITDIITSLSISKNDRSSGNDGIQETKSTSRIEITDHSLIADCASALTETVSSTEKDSHVVKIKISKQINQINEQHPIDIQLKNSQNNYYLNINHNNNNNSNNNNDNINNKINLIENKSDEIINYECGLLSKLTPINNINNGNILTTQINNTNYKNNNRSSVDQKLFDKVDLIKKISVVKLAGENQENRTEKFDQNYGRDYSDATTTLNSLNISKTVLNCDPLKIHIDKGHQDSIEKLQSKKNDSVVDFGEIMVQQNSNSNSTTTSSNRSVTDLNVNNPNYLYYMMTSGQFSPSDTLDSGTCSDLDNTSNSPTNVITTSPPPLPKKMAPKLEMHLQTTKVIMNNDLDATNNSNSNNNIHHHRKHQLSHHQHLHNNHKEQKSQHPHRAGSVTDSEESESSLSCDSLNSADFLNISTPISIENVKKSSKLAFLPDSLLRDIRGRKYSTGSIEKLNENFTTKIDFNYNEMHKEPSSQLNQKFKEIRERNICNGNKTYVLITQNGKQSDAHDDRLSRKFENDKFYEFHVNEHDIQGLVTNETNGLTNDETFAGYKDIRNSNNMSTIRSSKGTVRGVKNRVRNGIATFLEMQQSNIKNYKEKDSGKVVLYTTSMGIIRDTYAKCSNMKQILRTLLVKFEERDVFMSAEYQQEIRERMKSNEIQVPQLFVEGQHIGNAESVERLNETGELRQLLKPYKSINTSLTCQMCGGYRLLPCPSCKGSKKSVHRNHFTAEFVALKCMNCDEVGLVKCHNC